MRRPRRIHFFFLLVLILVVYGIERLVVTDREAIRALTERTAEAIRNRDFEALEACLHPAFELDGRDRARTVAYVRGKVRALNPIGTRIVLGDIALNEENATADGQITASVYGRPQTLGFKADFRKEDGAWFVKAVRMGPLPR